MSPKESEPAVTEFARGVADALSKVIEKRSISKRELARQIGRSNNYVAMRFRHEAAFTLTDIDVICNALGLDAGSFIAGLSVPANVTNLNVRRRRQDDLSTVPLASTAIAASKDNTPIDPERGGA
ncbi:helix-turn-helix domain-containing protein [Microbacterium sp. K41]|uniref:helix-turn-helix domain-containing protein n=1 Tax=Microbacterium sp. K41 TaxID=2305437 RepID=UPI001443D418|nr:helix-turn-helix transcriptional regulator [Microbacterium sp. K41]